jgi:hypothetical protein
MTKRSPFRHFKTSPKMIRLAVIFFIAKVEDRIITGLQVTAAN